MSIKKEIEELAASNSALDFSEKATIRLSEICSKGGSCDPAGFNAPEGHSAYMQVANILIQNGLFAAADSLLQDWWNELARRQQQENLHLHRGTAAHMLSTLHLHALDHGLAFRWSLHTHADDILSKHAHKGGGGKERLKTIFGLSTAALNRLTRIAEESLAIIEQDSLGWLTNLSFAEDIVRQFIIDESAYTQQIAHLPSRGQFPLTPPYFFTLLERVEHAQTTAAKGATFEEVAFYLFSLLPGCIPQRNLIDSDLAFESDIIVRNFNQMTNLSSDILGRYFLVECKNWADTIGVQEVGYFLFRMRLTHAKFGVIFSREGITGRNGEQNAKALIRRNYHEDGSLCIVIDNTDFKRLQGGEIGFFWLLIEKIEEFRFGHPRTTKPQKRASRKRV